MKEKKIDMHTVKKKKLRFLQRFFAMNICLQLSNLFVSERPILVRVMLYLVNCVSNYTV